MSRIAFVTTCKGRLHHLKQTLPLLLAAGPDQIVVVDYACPDGTADWVKENYPQIDVVRVTDDPGWCLPRARNQGASQVDSGWICFIDADIKIDPSWVVWMQSSLEAGYFYRAAPIEGARDFETWGTVICDKAAFDRIGGYDEAFRGWGGEDDELYFQLQKQGAQQESEYPSRFVAPISHDDDERVTFHEVKSKELQSRINQYYRVLKAHLMEELGSELSLETRRSMMMQITEAFRKNPDCAGKKRGPKIVVSLNSNSDGAEQFVSIGYRRRYGIFGPRSLRIRAGKGV